MTDLAEVAASNAARLGGTVASTEKAANPADSAGDNLPARRRIPMSAPVQRLQAPDIPGYFTYWFKGTPDRIQQAHNAWFEFVHQDEIVVNSRDLGSSEIQSGSTDLGTRVSVLANVSGDGEIGADGQPIRLYLMKQKLEYHLEDARISEGRNSRVADALTASFGRGDPVSQAAEGETVEDLANRYVDKKRTTVPDFFKPKRQVRR